MSRISDWLLRYLDKHGTTSRVKSPEGVPLYMESSVTEAEYQAWVAEQRILRAAEREAAKSEDGSRPSVTRSSSRPQRPSQRCPNVNSKATKSTKNTQ